MFYKYSENTYPQGKKLLEISHNAWLTAIGNSLGNSFSRNYGFVYNKVKHITSAYSIYSTSSTPDDETMAKNLKKKWFPYHKMVFLAIF